MGKTVPAGRKRTAKPRRGTATPRSKPKPVPVPTQAEIDAAADTALRAKKRARQAALRGY